MDNILVKGIQDWQSLALNFIDSPEKHLSHALEDLLVAKGTFMKMWIAKWVAEPPRTWNCKDALCSHGEKHCSFYFVLLGKPLEITRKQSQCCEQQEPGKCCALWAPLFNNELFLNSLSWPLLWPLLHLPPPPKASFLGQIPLSSWRTEDFSAWVELEHYR